MSVLSRRLFLSGLRPVRYKSTSGSASLQYCVDLVRKYDYENFLSSLLLPKKHRRLAFAIRAFNIEVANVDHNAKEASIKLMRLKFWEETVNKIFTGNPPNHPVALELFKALKLNASSKVYLDRLVKSRADVLSFQNLKEMEQYAENTSSPVFYLQLLSCGIQHVQIDHAFSHLGKGQGITTLLRSVPFHAQRSLVILPQDLLTKLKISHEAILRGKSNESLQDVVFQVASHAHGHLEKAQSLIMGFDRNFCKHFLPIVPVEGYLQRLQKVDFDVFHPSLQLRDYKLPLKLLWKSWFSFSLL